MWDPPTDAQLVLWLQHFPTRCKVWVNWLNRNSLEYKKGTRKTQSPLIIKTSQISEQRLNKYFFSPQPHLKGNPKLCCPIPFLTVISFETTVQKAIFPVLLMRKNHGQDTEYFNLDILLSSLCFNSLMYTKLLLLHKLKGTLVVHANNRVFFP